MKELTAFELECVSGAGWLQDNLASLGSKIGAAAWSKSSSLLNIDVPLIGTINLTTIAPDLGETVGKTIGSTVGGTIESALAGLPVVGSLLNKWLGN
ncbi:MULTISPECIES: hypothetical protein [Leclercia]|uniref:hypothetical protein n=1 Tax=Leclercia TaxID=83654 RepID=UPI00321B30E6